IRIIAVGKTGLGKSFTATVFGFNAEVGNDPDSMTKNVTIYSSDKYTYIDTPGFDDSDIKVEDREMIFDILTKLQDENITEIHTVFWFVEKGDRGTQSLQRQARFIESLAMNSKTKSNIWNNVIIVIKGEGSNIDMQSINAVKRAVNIINVGRDMLAKTSFIHVYLYDRLSKTRVSRFNTKELHEQGIYKKEELLDVYKKIIQEKYHAENPIKITFKNARCVKCGKEIDIRFADKYPCHTEVIHKHPNMKLVHPGQLVPIDGREFERRFIDDNEDIFIGDRKFGHSYIDSIPIYIMSSGCSVRCTECDKGTATQGCMKVCKGCGRPWGESHGCSKEGQHEFNTFYSSHDEL
ncbi:16272_t:CDS:2, partial [Entrophospora sp. SA101]